MKKLRSTLLAAAMVAAVGGGRASAQVAANCNDSAGGNTAYCLKGSDTWFDVMTASIAKKFADDRFCFANPGDPNCSNQTAAGSSYPTILQTRSATGASGVFYDGTGSGNAENQMKLTAGSVANRLGAQSIGAMSRNFRPAVITQFPSWAPTLQNVGGLDAAVIITERNHVCGPGLVLPWFTDGQNVNKARSNGVATRFACSGNAAVACLTDADCAASGAGTCGFGSYGAGYSQILQVLLSGVDGSGSTQACSDPRRVQALNDFSSCGGNPVFMRFYRRDDNSGTTDTFKDKIMNAEGLAGIGGIAVGAGGRFCNGTAVGSLGANKVHPNLNNQDLDPIRFPCKKPIAGACQGTSTACMLSYDARVTPTPADMCPSASPKCVGARQAVTCTDMTGATPVACCTSPNDPTCNSASCTQGFVTALSENDSDYSDITVTIGNRVGGPNPDVLAMGYAGREAASDPYSTKVMNTAAQLVAANPPSDDLVRSDTYLLARRLFLQRGPAVPARDTTPSIDKNAVSGAAGAPPPATGPTCQNNTAIACMKDSDCGTFGPCQFNQRINNNAQVASGGLTCPDGSSNLCTGGGTTQRTYEDALFLFMTDPNGRASRDGQPGRCNLDAILPTYGFLPCSTDCTTDPSGNTNLCSKTPYVAPPSAPSGGQPTGGFWAYAANTSTVKVTATSGGAPSATACVATGATGTVSASGTCSVGGNACTNASSCGAGESCNYTQSCPAFLARPQNYACTRNAECASSVCADIGTGLRICQ
jgi:hypothetical protein